MNRDQHLTAHRDEQIVENALWLLNDVGMHREQVCRRLGLSWDTLEKKIARVRKRAESDTTEVAGLGEGSGATEMPEVRLTGTDR